MRNNENQIRTNLGYNIAYQILILIVPFITAPYVSRVLHPEGVGTYSVTTAIVKYFWMFALLGMSNYGNRRIASVRDNADKLSCEFTNLFFFQLTFSLTATILFIVYIFTFGFVRYDRVIVAQIPYILSAVFEVSWFFYGTEQFKFMVLRNAAIKLLTMLSVFVFVKSASDIWIYVLINSLSLLFGQLCLWPFLLKQIKFTGLKKKEVIKHLKPNLVLSVSVIAVSVYILMDKIMIEALSERAQVGFYENTEKILNMCIGIVGAIGSVMLPRITYLMSKNEGQQVRDYLSKSMRYIMLLAIAISFGIAGIAKEFSIVYYGNEFAVCGITISLVSIAIVFYSWENILKTQYLLPSSKDEIFVKGTIVAAALNLIVNALLIPRFGAVGAVVGTIMAQCGAAFYETLKIKKELPIKEYIIGLIPGLFAGLIMMFTCRLIGNALGPKIITILSQVCIGGIVYVILLGTYLYKRDDELVLSIYNRIKKNK